MPELPEVETVARDLQPRLVGATIVGARTNWVRTLRSQDPIGFADGVAGRTVLSVGRRAKQLVVGLSGDAALTIHLKMTGQLFVVPADRPEDPYIRLVLELDDGRELRFRDIRKFGKIGLYGRDPVSGELVEEAGGSAVFGAVGPEPLDPDFTLRDFRKLIRRRVVVDRRTAPLHGLAQDRADRLVQAALVRRTERLGGAERMETRPPQRLIGVDVPNARQERLVGEERLETALAPSDLSA